MNLLTNLWPISNELPKFKETHLTKVTKQILINDHYGWLSGIPLYLHKEVFYSSRVSFLNCKFILIIFIKKKNLN